MAIKKTDNSFFFEKLALRQKFLPQKKKIKVLECYAGTGKLWSQLIKNNPDRDIHRIKIDIDPKDNITLKGDNLKYLSTLNLSHFDIIDLDTYGIPFDQCEIIFFKKYTGIIHLTVIQNMFGELPRKMLEQLGYTKQMVNKCPAVFNKNGIDKFLQYLSIKNVKKITYCNPEKRKMYAAFIINN